LSRPGLPDLVIFDCDGVLIDSETIAARTEAAYLNEIGFAITTDDIMSRYVGLSMSAMIADIEMRYAQRLPADFGDKLSRRSAAAFEAELVATAGVETVLKTLRNKVCVASSSAPERLRHSLSLVGLLRYFDPHVFSATHVERRKPAPDLFLFAADRMAARPHACVVIEDSEAGVCAAVAAGMRVLGFTGGSHCGPDHAIRLHRAGAAATFAQMTRLTELL
jgi:HAD superfamily hydrolase (TIGR01509 family)